jgi:hypothetical protein
VPTCQADGYPMVPAGEAAAGGIAWATPSRPRMERHGPVGVRHGPTWRARDAHGDRGAGSISGQVPIQQLFVYPGLTIDSMLPR